MGMVIRLRCRPVCLAQMHQSFSPWQLYMFFEAFGAGGVGLFYFCFQFLAHLSAVFTAEVSKATQLNINPLSMDVNRSISHESRTSAGSCSWRYLAQGSHHWSGSSAGRGRCGCRRYMILCRTLYYGQKHCCSDDKWHKNYYYFFCIC